MYTCRIRMLMVTSVTSTAMSLPCEGEDMAAMGNRYEISDMKEPLMFNAVHMNSS